MSDVRVLVIANNLLARTGLAALLNIQQALDVVGQVSGNEEANTLIDDLAVYRPDVVVYDLGYEPLATLANVSALTETEIPLITLIPESEFINSVLPILLEANAYGILLRESDPGLLEKAIAAVVGGLVVLDPLLTTSIVPQTTISNPLLADVTLTPRESEVLQLLAEGLPNKSIAQNLEISPNTVKFHVNAILSKLDAQSRTEAVVRATQLGLIVL